MFKILVTMVLMVSGLFGAVVLTNTGAISHVYFRGYDATTPNIVYYYDVDNVKRNVFLDTITTNNWKYVPYIPYPEININDKKVSAGIGSIIFYQAPASSFVASGTMVRTFVCNRKDSPDYGVVTYVTRSMVSMSQGVDKSIIVPESSWAVINDVKEHTILFNTPNNAGQTVDYNGDAIVIQRSGRVDKILTKYVYIKNNSGSVQTVSYTGISTKGGSSLAPISHTIVCPKDSVTEIIGMDTGSTVTLGTSVVKCELGDRLVISNDNAVEMVQPNKTNPLTVYPNPSNGTLNVKLNSKSDIRIFTLDGKLIQSYKNVSSIKADALQNGVYMVSAKQGGVEMKKMITVAR